MAPCQVCRAGGGTWLTAQNRETQPCRGMRPRRLAGCAAAPPAPEACIPPPGTPSTGWVGGVGGGVKGGVRQQLSKAQPRPAQPALLSHPRSSLGLQARSSQVGGRPDDGRGLLSAVQAPTPASPTPTLAGSPSPLSSPGSGGLCPERALAV